MDSNASSNKMITIELGKEGKFLSGRSRAAEIVKNFGSSNMKESDVELDFSGVESCSQSFISELIFRLKESGVQAGKIKPKSIQDTDVEKRFDTELSRLEMA